MNKAAVHGTLLDSAAALLRSGGLIGFPTETVYGLGADARNPEAVARIFEAKGRPADHPLIVHIANAQQMTEWARDIPDVAWQLAHAFWPGPLTIILPRAKDVPDAVTGGLNTVALRVPNHPLALALLSRFASGIAAPSANRYGRVSPTTAEHVRTELGAKVDLVLDGGPCVVGIESTIVDASRTSAIRILRPGAIGPRQLRGILGATLKSVGSEPVRCPGRKASHYAPSARVVLVSGNNNALQEIERWQTEGLRVGLLSSQRPLRLPDSLVWLPLPKNLADQARELYQRLREADYLNLQVLVVVPPAERGIGHAIADRLQRAAGLGDEIDIESDFNQEIGVYS